MKIIKQPLKWQVKLVLAGGVFAISTTAIFIRLAIASAKVSGVVFSILLAILFEAICSSFLVYLIFN